MKPYAADRVVLETFVGRQRALSEITARVLTGRSTLVVAGRRAGKTMVLRALESKLLTVNVHAIYVDVQSLAAPTGAAGFVSRVMAQTTGSTHQSNDGASLEDCVSAV